MTHVLSINAFMHMMHVNIYRQNRKERLMQKRWSHINPHLIGPLDEKEISLKVRNKTLSNKLMKIKF